MANYSERGRFRIWDQTTDPYSHLDLMRNFNHLDHLIGGPDSDSTESTRATLDGNGVRYSTKPSVWLNVGTGSIDGGDTRINSDRTTDGLTNQDRTLYKVVTGLVGNDVPLGAVICWWRPNGTFKIPYGWQPMDGRTLDQTQHSWGAFSVTLPDARNRFILGAATTTPSDTNANGYTGSGRADGSSATGDDPANGPGIGYNSTASANYVNGTVTYPGNAANIGVQTSNSSRTVSHTHAAGTLKMQDHKHLGNSHTHAINDHIHRLLSHTHTVNAHTHTISAHTHGMRHYHAVTLRPDSTGSANVMQEYGNVPIRGEAFPNFDSGSFSNSNWGNLNPSSTGPYFHVPPPIGNSQWSPIVNSGSGSTGIPVLRHGHYGHGTTSLAINGVQTTATSDQDNYWSAFENERQSTDSATPTASSTALTSNGATAGVFSTALGGNAFVTIGGPNYDFTSHAYASTSSSTPAASTQSDNSLTGLAAKATGTISVPGSIADVEAITGSTASSLTSLDTRPAYVGLLYLMKVKKSYNITNETWESRM